jgi:hypothetical protein
MFPLFTYKFTMFLLVSFILSSQTQLCIMQSAVFVSTKIIFLIISMTTKNDNCGIKKAYLFSVKQRD